MDLLQATFLGIIQGLTEFLPVSSSGHLVLAQTWFGIQEPPVFYDIMLHLATALAVIWLFRKKITSMVIGALKELGPALKQGPKGFLNSKGDLRFVLLLLIGCFVTGVIGVAFEDWFESMFGNARGVGFAMILTGCILLSTLLSPKEPRTDIPDRMTWTLAIIIGLAQGAAVMPGLSRSGTTISAALLLGLCRPLAVEFSFLMSVPVILGVVVKKLLSHPPGIPLASLLAGMVSAFVVGYACLFLLTFMVKRGNLHWFAFYCIPMGLLVLYLT